VFVRPTERTNSSKVKRDESDRKWLLVIVFGWVGLLVMALVRLLHNYLFIAVSTILSLLLITTTSSS
jgi:hypothetical protein